MEGVKISQIRWPVGLYEWLRNEAYVRRQSINQTVTDIIEAAMEQSRNVSRHRESRNDPLFRRARNKNADKSR